MQVRYGRRQEQDGGEEARREVERWGEGEDKSTDQEGNTGGRRGDDLGWGNTTGGAGEARGTRGRP